MMYCFIYQVLSTGTADFLASAPALPFECGPQRCITACPTTPAGFFWKIYFSIGDHRLRYGCDRARLIRVRDEGAGGSYN